MPQPTRDHGNGLVAWILTGLLVLAAVIVAASAGAENLSSGLSRIEE